MTWSAFVPGVICAVGAAACAAGTFWGRNLPVAARGLLAVLACPLAAFAFLLISIGLGFSGR